MGFTQPASHLTAGKLLPYHFTLTRSDDAKRAVCFCCTFLKVALTGRYPASCSVEFRLSSDLVARDYPFSSSPSRLRVTHLLEAV